MKNLLPVLLFSFWFFSATAQGKYAGGKKNLIGIRYTDSRNIAGLENWQYREGSVISPFDNPEMITADVFQKGTVYVVLFSIMEDTASREFFIADVLEIKNVLKSQQVKTALCREGDTENPEIVALIKPGKTEFSNAIKAWRFNRDKRRVEIKNVKYVKCLNEGFDLTLLKSN